MNVVSPYPGTVFMPPKWALGYQQCRWSYDSAQKVMEVSTIAFSLTAKTQILIFLFCKLLSVAFTMSH